MPRAVSAASVNWLTTRALPPVWVRLQVHLPRIILEQPQFGDFCGQCVGGCFGVIGHGAEEDQQAGANVGNHGAVNGHGGSSDALQERAHVRISSR